MSMSNTEKTVKDIRRNTRRKFSTEEKIRIVLDGLRGESSIAELCAQEGINPNLYYRWSKDFLEAGKKRPKSVQLCQLSRPLQSMLKFVPGSVERHCIRVDVCIEFTRIAVPFINSCCNNRGAKAVTYAPHRYFSLKHFEQFISR